MARTTTGIRRGSRDADKPASLVVIGAGMAAHRLVMALGQRTPARGWTISVIGDEPHLPYDRISLASVVADPDTADLTLSGGLDLAEWHVGDPAVGVDPGARVVTTRSGTRWHYDALVFATGSRPIVPPVPGADAWGCLTFRTLADVVQLHRRARRARRGVVIGGGLLGLEAAGALQAAGVEPTVIEGAEWLLPLQVDSGGGAILERIIASRGIAVMTGARVERIETRRGRVQGVVVGGATIPADLVIFAVGVAPRDDLARESKLAVGDRGGILVDESCRTSAEGIFAIGECARIRGAIPGLLAPSQAMADTVAAVLVGDDAAVPEFDTSTKLKLMGVDVATSAAALGSPPGALEVVLNDPASGRYRKLIVTDDARTLVGGMLVGAVGDYALLRAQVGQPVAGDISAIAAGTAAVGGDLPDEATACSCRNVSAGTIRACVRGGGHGLAAVKGETGAATGCGSCLPLVRRLMDEELARQGVSVDRSLCEHFRLTRRELFEVTRQGGLRTFSEVIATHGTGRGCAICKPVVASILASQGKGRVLDPALVQLQDTNDRALANLQRDGSYSVVPRIPGGEITPQKLAVIAQVASKYDLYTKITGGQRIALFGAGIEQLPLIWEELVAAGFESGHAYGKAVRTVKSCVGSTWCRFGVQDSVGMAIRLELRYRGLRSPHKIKLGVSGCARECAEARAKDVGVIATESGWNVYVGGNGGFSPRHAQQFAADLDDAELVRVIDRLIAYYVRTADRLERMAQWVDTAAGGIDRLKQIILHDQLGIGAELEADIEAHVNGYEDEWKVAISDPQHRQLFTSFANAPDTPDPDLRYARTREQRQPALAIPGQP